MDEINYSISFEKPHTHYCEVEITLRDIHEDSVVFTMPVWTPGSYLIREFAKNVEDVSAGCLNKVELPVEKFNKNSWRVNSKGQSEINFRYKVYCNELTVRTSEINSTHAFISSSGVFMFVSGFEENKCILKVNLPLQWKEISTGLKKESDNIYYEENYDLFIDCPLEIGNQTILTFDIREIKHFICITGKGNYKSDILVKDFKAIAEEEIQLLGGEIPYKTYTYIIHLVERGGGGLEHHNSFVAQMVRWNFTDEKLYKKFLGLVSHEFFHLWNVKRIRPVSLGPFDYSRENYTNSLWVAEGWTSFYDDLILRRCGLFSNKDYYEFLDVAVNDIMRFTGRFKQSLKESSFDTWIKFYRKDENFNNSQVSYYSKGALVAMMLNIEIIKNTEAKKSLDDALRLLYENYKTDKSKGYTDEDIKEICQHVAGKNLDEFWNNYVKGTEDLPLESYLSYSGLKLINENDTDSCTLDIETRSDEGKLLITKVFAGGGGYESGLNFNDELISIDGVRMNSDLLKTFLKNYKEGDEMKILINRSGLINEIDVKLLKPLPKYRIEELQEKTIDQEKILKKWLDG